jgi:outer membrane protein assembly factor BamB
VLSWPAPAAVAATATPGASLHVDVAHTGNASGTGFSLPVERAWSRGWNGIVSYPVIADGKVFVAVRNQVTDNRKVLALDATTGETRWRVRSNGGYDFFGLAADGGRLYTLDSSGMLSALDIDTGALDWSAALPDQTMFTSPPTADDGIVYVGGAGSGGTVYAVDGATGDVMWTAPVANGDHSAPTITPYGIVVGYACLQVFALAPADGALVWHHDTFCSGGGGRTAAYFDDRVYARDGYTGAVLHASSGGDAGSFTTSAMPAFSGSTGYFLEQGTLRARDLGTLHASWSFAGDGTLVSAPMVIDNRVFVASSSRKLFVLRADTGRLRKTMDLGAPFATPDEHNAVVLTDMNAGAGLLAVPASGRLVVFR